MRGPWEIADPFTNPVADHAVREALKALASPGSFYSGAERVAMAEHVRVSRGLASSAQTTTVLSQPERGAVSRVAVEAMNTREADVAAWKRDGRDVRAYVELVAVVALTTSIDSYRIACGGPLDPLPDPLPGGPIPVVDDAAVRTNSLVPTVGAAIPKTALSALPDEAKVIDMLAGAFYIDGPVHRFDDPDPDEPLLRSQIELVAARVSLLNECFF